MGIGKRLMEAVEDWAKKMGASCILLNCGNREERKQAQEFYQHIGYQVIFGLYKKTVNLSIK